MTPAMKHPLLAVLALAAATHAQTPATPGDGAAQSMIPPRPMVAEIAQRNHGQTGVSFRTSDAELQKLFDAAEAKAAANLYPISPGMKVLVEGGGYAAVYLETQPMGGEMYAKRDPQAALNNQLIFMLGQRADGRIPGCIRSVERARKGYSKDGKWLEYFTELPKLGLVTEEREFSGYCYPTPAWKMYFWTGKDRQYLELLESSLESFDAYLWKTRDSNHDGLLETWCTWDTGEDGSTRYIMRGAPTCWPFDQPPGAAGLPNPQDPKDFAYYWCERKGQGLPPPAPDEMLAPFASMDVMAYSYGGRATLARIAHELGNGREAYWQRKAEDVRQRLIAGLWLPERHACFDRDRTGRRLDELIHNNLRCMWHGVFTQAMADEFVRYHLLNPAEFWTLLPLVSIAANDRMYKNVGTPGGNWAGLPQSLTYQRAIRALENYGHFAEVTLLGDILLKAVARKGCTFPLELVTTAHATASNPDGYGPLILACLEYTAHLHGIHIDEDRVWFSGVRPGGHDFTYTQRLNDTIYQLTCEHGQLRGSLNGRELFTCTAGTRVVTDAAGKILEMVGINPQPQQITLRAGGSQRQLTVAPNQVYGCDHPEPVLLRSAPFDSPYQPPQSK